MSDEVHVPIVINQEDLGGFGERIKAITDTLGGVGSPTVKSQADLTFLEAHAALRSVERFRASLPAFLGHIKRLEQASAAWRASRQAAGISGPSEKQAKAAEMDAYRLRIDMYRKAHPQSP